MQKVEGSSPFSRSSETPAAPGVFAFSRRVRRFACGAADQLGGPICNRALRGPRRRPTACLASCVVKALEEVAYEAGRAALADQETIVAGVRQRTGTLLAAHALVASFLGATTIREAGFNAWAWVAVAALVLGLVVAAVLLAPWKLKFAVDARSLYDELYEQAAAEWDAGTLGWLASAGYLYQALREENADRVRWMSALSGLLGALMVVQTLAWLTGLAVN
jgi:hypothetical protein